MGCSIPASGGTLLRVVLGEAESELVLYMQARDAKMHRGKHYRLLLPGPACPPRLNVLMKVDFCVLIPTQVFADWRQSVAVTCHKSLWHFWEKCVAKPFVFGSGMSSH